VSETPATIVKSPDLVAMGLDRSRPLVIVDVDEVLGLFMQGFADYLALQGLEFRLERFALFQNIYRPGEAEHLDVSLGKSHFDDFFRHAAGDMALAEGGVKPSTSFPAWRTSSYSPMHQAMGDWPGPDGWAAIAWTIP